MREAELALAGATGMPLRRRRPLVPRIPPGDSMLMLRRWRPRELRLAIGIILAAGGVLAVADLVGSLLRDGGASDGGFMGMYLLVAGYTTASGIALATRRRAGRRLALCALAMQVLGANVGVLAWRVIIGPYLVIEWNFGDRLSVLRGLIGAAQQYAIGQNPWGLFVDLNVLAAAAWLYLVGAPDQASSETEVVIARDTA